MRRAKGGRSPYLIPVGLFLTGLLFTAAPPTLSGQDAAEASVTLSIPVEIAGVAARSLEARFSPEQELLALDRFGLVEALRGELAPALLDELSDADAPWVSPAELQELGLGVDYDRSRLSVSVTVPLEIRPLQELSVARRSRSRPYPELSPARGSASLILRSRLDHSYLVDSGESLLDVEAQIGPAISFSSATAEVDMTLDSGGDTPFRVDTARVLVDFPGAGLRGLLGDVRYSVRGFQSRVPVVGVTVQTEDALTGGGAVRSGGATLFDLDEPAEARFVVNGRTVRTERLAPGRYSISDFPLLPGINDVTVILENESGERTVISDTVPFAARLLAPGEQDYAGAVGFPRWTPADTLLSGYYYRGLLPALTAGAYAQASLERQLLGVGGVLASPGGTIRLDLAGSRDADGRLAPGALGEYRLSLPGRPWLPSLSLLGEYRGDSFAALSMAETDVPEADAAAAAQAARWSLTSSLSQRLPLGLRLNLSGRYRLYREPRPQSLALSAVLSRGFGRNVTMNISTTARRVGADWSWGARIFVSASGPRPATTVSWVQDVAESRSDVRLSGARQTGIGKLSLSGSATGLPPTTAGGESLGGSVRLAAERFELSASERITLGDRGHDRLPGLERLNSSLSVGTGLYFADGALAFGPPARGGFVLAQALEALPIEGLGLGSGSAAEQVGSGLFGAAVLAGLTPYQPQSVHLDLIGLPIDYSVGPTSFTVTPGYRRGTVVPVRAEQFLYARGRLVDGEGEGVALRALNVLRPEASAEAPPVTTSFTDEQGFFELYELGPGRYRLASPGGEFRSQAFNLSGEGEGMRELGEIRLEPKTPADDNGGTDNRE